MARRVALVGTMGAGKSTVGRALAARLGWPLLDNDELLRLRTGRSAAELLAGAGEPALRAAERQALRDALDAGEPAVVTVAAGTAAEPATRAILAGTVVVWLRADPRTLVRRLGRDTGRPWLGDDPAAAVGRLDAERRPAFAALADHVLDADGADGGDVAELVAAIVARLPEEWAAWRI